ncbi:unnamed protein product [Rotaria socialis]|uniref:Uncharacterized protein n=1 Tax=Rotaria socialis TaxID=392032 RepID=A0A817TPN4_9BILA|nr:unnamed protein product [Rotaria socialis]
MRKNSKTYCRPIGLLVCFVFVVFLLVIRITHSRSLEDRLYAIKGTASSSYSRTSLFSSNNANVNLDQDNSLKDVTNETTFNNELLHLNSQRLTVSYSISNGSKN